MRTSSPFTVEKPVSRPAKRKPKSLKDQVAQLEAELLTSRRREEVARTALMSMHRELEDAYVRLGQQQDKLRVLVATLQTERYGFGPGTAGA